LYSFDCIAGGLAGRPLPLVEKPHLLLHGDEPRVALLHEGVNTSSSEERNAQARKQQTFLRQLRQDNFISLSVYQQALSNAIALYRDAHAKKTKALWPEWVRRTNVDAVGHADKDETNS